jgi:subtilisin family serine protease/PKD repeat protein
MIRKLLLLPLLLCVGFVSFSQTVHEWYQDGIVIFQMKTDVEYHIPVRNKHVDIDRVDFIAKLKDTYDIYEMTQKHPDDPDELLRHTYEIKFDKWAQVESLIADIQRNPEVAYAEKKELHRHFLTPNDLGPNSASGSGMWHLYRINAPQAWDLSTGDPNIVVAVTDDAILTTHVDLQNKLVQGYDAPTGGTDPNPCGSNNGNHGTHVSGTVGADTDNNTGVSSIGFDVSIMPVKIGNCNGSLTHGYEGINYAANNGADVINMSWGGGGFSNYGQNICNAAANAGAILVAAAGNDGVSTVFYPAGYNNVIAVASTTTNDAKSGFSQFGTWIDIAAPGSAIRSTYATSNTAYNRIQGTSMASPNVAGLVGLIKSYVPQATNQDIINCLLSTADNIDAVNPSYVGQLGSGRINAFAALQCIGAFNLPLDVGITEILDPGTTVCGNSFTPQVRLRNFGTNTITSVEINYEWNGTPFVFNWSGNLAQGQNEIVTLPTQVAPNGSYTFTASTSNPNASADLNTGNDASDQVFLVDVNGQTIDLTLDLDCYGSEISWAIVDDNGNTLYTGGGYSDNGLGQTITESFCLPVGCYSFEINDTYGDGMHGSQWNGCNVDGNYTITGPTGDTLVQMTAPNGDFGFGTTDAFCVVSPNVLNDAGISAIITPTGLNCSSSITPTVEIRNYGLNTLTSATINYQTTGGVQTFAWTGSLATGQTENVTLPALTTGGGLVTLTAFTSNPNGQLDDDATNDQNSAQLTVFTTAAPLPFSEDFEGPNVFTPGGWTLENPDGATTWEMASVGGITPGSTAAKIDFFNYAVAAQRDAMITPLINLAGYSSAQLDFDHAYRRFNQNAADSLVIYVSSDCGQTWDVVFAAAEDGTGSFATQTTNTNAFTPSISDDWCFAGGIGASCFSVDLTPYVGQQVFVKFESYNAGTIGNNLFIDNINIDGVPNAAPPVPSYSSNTTAVCEGGTITFTDASTANITNWSWSFPGGTPATSTSPNPTVTYANAGTYDVILTVTNSFGTETLTTSNAVSVNTTPNVSISAGTQQLCEGSTTQITASGATSYTWDSGLGVGSTQTVSPTQTTTYTVTGSNGLACEATESITITVNTLPTVVASSDATICSGNTVQISASGASSYLWDNGAGNGAIQNVTPTQTTVYTVTGTDANNCSNTDNVTITVEDVPTVTVSSSNLSICPGGTVSMTASGADSYIWSPTSGLSSATSAAVVATPSTTTTYTVEGTNNCGTDTEDITVTVLPTPTTPVITQTGNTLSVTLQAGETATWAYNGFPAGTGSSITMQGDGIYLVTITNANGCESSNSGSYEMDVTSVQEIGLDALLNLYPNPTKGMFTVEFGEHEGLQIDVTDALGRSVVRTIQVETGNTQTAVDISHCSPGIYNVVIQTNRGKINRKVTLH